MQFIETLAFPEADKGPGQGQGLASVQGVPQTAAIFSVQMSQGLGQGPAGSGPGPVQGPGLAINKHASHGNHNHTSSPNRHSPGQSSKTIAATGATPTHALALARPHKDKGSGPSPPAAPSSSSSSSLLTSFAAVSMMELLSAPAIGMHWRAQVNKQTLFIFLFFYTLYPFTPYPLSLSFLPVDS